MAFINAVIKHDGVDISNSTVSYNRDHQICTGVANLEVVVPLTIGRTFKPWDVIEIWENGNKKGKFYIDAVSKSAKDGAIQIKSTDGSKRLTDYFVTDTYTIDYLSYGRYWIEKFLDEAGVSYTFTVADNGSPLSNNTSLGYDSAFSMITTLLQQSGWYIYFDNDGEAIIGNLNKDISAPDHIVDATDIADIQRELDDDRLRNRAVVWGNSNPTYGEVFVDISVQTPWNYDAQDKRAVVLSNSSIYNHAQALELAQKLLHEFTEIKDEKVIVVVNDYNIQLGEIIQVNSKYWSGKGLVTGITATMGKDGLVYQININKKCPRLFTFFSTLPPTVSGFYVYIGTEADGIWRKYTAGDTFSNDSSGLEDLKINDMAIRGGNFSAIADDGFLYTKTSELGAWNKYTPPNLRDINGVTYSNMDLSAKACSVNMSDNIIAGYNFIPVSGIVASGIPPSGLSWVLELTGGQSLIRAEQVVISGGAGDGYDFNIFDLESTGEYNIISVSGLAPISGYVMDAVAGGAGYRTVCLTQGEHWRVPLPPDSKSTTMGWGYGDHNLDDSTRVYGWAESYPSSLICDNDGTTFWYIGWEGHITKLDMEAETSTSYTFTRPAEWLAYDPYEVSLTLRHSGGNNFDIVAVVEDNGYPVTITVYLYSFTLGDSTLTTRGSSAIPSGAAYKGIGLIGSQALVGYNFSGTAHAKIVNLVSGAFTDEDIYIGGWDGYSGIKGWTELFSTGDSIIFSLTFVTGTDITHFDGCPLFPADVPKTTELWAVGWKITEYGGSSLVGPTLLKTFPTYDGSQGYGDETTHYADISGSTVVTLDPTTNTLLRKGYTLIGLKLTHQPCASSSYPRWYELWQGGVSFPDMALFYDLPGNGGQYVRQDLTYNPPVGGAEWVGYNPTDDTGGANFNPLSGKFGGAWYHCYNFSNDTGIGWSEYRKVPAFGTSFGYHTFTTWSIDDFGAQNNNNTPIDDLTGLVVGDQGISEGGNTWIRSVSVYDNRTAQSRIDFPFSSGGFAGITQKFGVCRGYSMLKAKNFVGDSFPMGTILKHTSTPELGTKITATDDSLEQTLGIFEVIKTTQVPCKVDIAQGVPTVIYDIPKVDGDDSQEFWGSVQNADGSFYNHADPKPVYESRNFSLPNPGSFPTVSGEFNPIDYQRYVGISNREGILASEYYLDTPWVNLVTVYSGVAVSGLITHFETSNFVPEGTYFFYTVSGVKSFYQKNPEEGFWTDYSASLPESAITIIRVDDLI